MGYPDTCCICLGASCTIRNGFFTYTQMPLVSKSELNPALKLHEKIETILYLIDALLLENYKIRLPVTDQTLVIMFVLLGKSFFQGLYFLSSFGKVCKTNIIQNTCCVFVCALRITIKSSYTSREIKPLN